MISINLDRDCKDRYLVKNLTVQNELIDFLETIPVCVGLGVQGDVDNINHFYSLFSVRRDPNKIHDMLERIKNNTNLQKYYKNTYDALQLLFCRIFDKPAMRIDSVDEKLVNTL